MLNRKPYYRQASKAGDGESAETQMAVLYNPRAFHQTTYFTSYLTKEYAAKLLEKKAVYRGTMQVLATGYRAGNVQTELGNIFIPNKESMNRAFDGDVVYVQIIDQQSTTDDVCDWSITGAAGDAGAVSIKQSKLVGHVVYAEYSLPVHVECLYDQDGSRTGFLHFIPISKKFPGVDVVSTSAKEFRKDMTYIIEIRDWMPQMVCPAGVLISEGRVMNLSTLDEICEYTMLKGGITWTYKQNQQLPEDVVRYLAECEYGLCSDVGLERSQVFALDEAVLQDIQAQIARISYKNAVFERQSRRNLLDELVFTIDPDTAKDFDDACHISIITSNKTVISFKQLAQLPGEQQAYIIKNAREYEIGVHIADVTHYVQPNSTLDVAAQQTTTSVYITDRCCPMYPFELADGLCSLNPGVPRYCFSCVFRLNREGALLPQTVWFGRTVVMSHCRLDYVAAQDMIDGKITPDDSKTLFKDRWPVARGYQKAIVLAVQHMNAVSYGLRKQRNELGALYLENDTLRWSVDSKLNVSVQQPEMAGDAHHLIEEMMLTANCLVAMRLVQTFPGVQILRSHPPPKTDGGLNGVFAQNGYTYLDMKTGNTLVRSIGKLRDQFAGRLEFNESVLDKKQQAQLVANTCFVYNNLMRAAYIVGLSAQQQLFNHWGIHAQLYMHFTSPIRRYADDICHRMLTAALEIEYLQQPTQITKHALVFKEYTELYTADVLPCAAFLRECDRLNPISDKAEPAAQKIGRHSFLEQIEAGYSVDLSKQKNAQVLQKSIDYLVNYDMHMNSYEKEEHTSEMQLELDHVKDNLAQFAHMTFDQLKALVDACNQHAIEAANIETIHHYIMMGIKFRNEGITLKTHGYIVAAKEASQQIMLLVPQYGESFSCKTELAVNEKNRIKVFGYNINVPFNMQDEADEESFIELEFLKPIALRIVADPQICLGVQVWLEGVEAQAAEK